MEEEVLLGKHTFKGGVHPAGNKDTTAEKNVIEAVAPTEVVLPMRQHIGADAKPVVKKGDEILLGQKVGEMSGFVSSPVFSSVSGKVTAVEKRLHASGDYVMSVVIENDGQDRIDPEIKPYGDHQQYSSKEIVEIIQNAGIVGLGGAAFPTHVKLTIPEGKNIDAVIINGAECEPYITADDHLMREHSELVVQGLRIAMRAVGASRGIIGIEDNKPEAIEKMRACILPEDAIDVAALKTKYPQGAEKQLITACTGREVPSGGLPADVGIVVMNAGTAYQTAITFETGMPLYKRLLTCTGDAVVNPQTMEVRLGTTVQSVIEQCGGFKETPEKVIMGGPMMGIALPDTGVPVQKGTSGILCLTPFSAAIPDPSNCIRCGKCADICPMHLQPLFIAAWSEKENWEQCETFHAMDCIECGSCSYICPSKRRLVAKIRESKRMIVSRKKKETKK